MADYLRIWSWWLQLGDGAHAIRTATTAMMSAVGAVLQPTVLQAVQKMPVTGTAAVIMQTLVANLVSMAPPGNMLSRYCCWTPQSRPMV
jgi:hypothetical protein